jgi:predicted MFS family arabinose efflux permease
VYASILLGAISQASFIWLDGSTSAIILNFLNGICSIIAVVSVLTLAADYCPDGSEGFTYALLMSIHNAASPLSSYVGAYLYDNTFHQALTPLILVSAAVTAATILLMPVLSLSQKKKDGDKGDDK